MVEITQASAERFTTATLSLYHGPFIKIRLEPSKKEYTVSKPLLCAESPVFLAMFKPGFREHEEQAATVQEETDIVSARSIQALIQWLYTRIINLGIKDNSECVSATIELARLADKYGIVGIQSAVADKIRKVICSRNNQNGSFLRDNTASLKSAHIISGTFLPRLHPVRRILAAACVCGYLQQKNYKFAQEAEDHPNFAADLLREVQLALDTASVFRERVFTVRDPVDNAETRLQRT